MGKRLVGGFTNRMLERVRQPAPVVGMGATQIMYSDRHAFTVIAVAPSGKTAIVQRDVAMRADSNGVCDAQSYTYTPDPNGATRKISLRKDGCWREVGQNGGSYLLGVRDEHYDYGF